MRILHVLHTSLPYSCGYSLRADRILEHQKAAGFTVGVVTSAQQPAPNRDEVREGVSYFRTPLKPLHRSPIREFQLMRWLASAVGRAADELRPDIIHAHSPILVGFPALRVARRRGARFVYEVRDLWENASVDHGKFSVGSLPYRAVRGAETLLLRKADAVVTIGELLREELQARTAVQVEVAANGVDLDAFQPLAPQPHWARAWNAEGREVIAYIGSFQPYEGLDTLIRAMEDVRKTAPNALLLIAGDGPSKSSLEALVKALDLAKIVHFTGRVPHDRVKEIYAIASVLVYPRIDTLTTRLTTPLKPLEAMAMQKAVISSDLPALRELVRDGETGLMFPAGNAAELAKRIALVLHDPAQRSRIADAALEWVRARRSWNSTLAIYEPLYRRLMA
jgi:PEP-CTERM/exosortase A-associated glycosyltransferase